VTTMHGGTVEGGPVHEGETDMDEAETRHEQRLLQAFVMLADSLVTGFDVVGVLTDLSDACVDLLDADAAGLMVVDQRGQLQMMAGSSEQTRFLELLQLQTDDGPCVECFRTQAPVEAEDGATMAERWPEFAAAAAEAGYHSIVSVPMRLRDQTIGALNLLRSRIGTMPDSDKRIAQALADVATIAILQHRRVIRTEEVTNQLQGALNTRIIIEQAKGLLAERESVELDVAFSMLRDYARPRGERLADVARAFVEGRIDVDTLQSARSRSEKAHG
jgi:transcriptional regulator with GAF, ATPase, and Fis domain